LDFLRKIVVIKEMWKHFRVSWKIIIEKAVWSGAGVWWNRVCQVFVNEVSGYEFPTISIISVSETLRPATSKMGGLRKYSIATIARICYSKKKNRIVKYMTIIWGWKLTTDA
jgi:hypothetical protein